MPALGSAATVVPLLRDHLLCRKKLSLKTWGVSSGGWSKVEKEHLAPASVYFDQVVYQSIYES